MDDNDLLYLNLKNFLDKRIDTDVTLDSLGIDYNDFQDEASDIIMTKINDIAAEKIE